VVILPFCRIFAKGETRTSNRLLSAQNDSDLTDIQNPAIERHLQTGILLHHARFERMETLDVCEKTSLGVCGIGHVAEHGLLRVLGPLVQSPAIPGRPALPAVPDRLPTGLRAGVLVARHARAAERAGRTDELAALPVGCVKRTMPSPLQGCVSRTLR
jgi:hypothetical protein